MVGHVSVDKLDPLLEGCAPTNSLHMGNCRKVTAWMEEAPKIQAIAESVLFLYGFNSKLFTKREGRNWTAIVKE